MSVDAGVRAPAAAGDRKGRSVRQRLGQRWTAGHVLPLVLALLAGVFMLAALKDRSSTTPVAVATRVIPAGQIIDSGDTRVVTVRTSQLPGLVPVAQLGSGLVAAVPIRAGDPITRSVISHGPANGAGMGSMSIPVSPDRANGGSISTGDRVDVIEGSGGGATYVAQNLAVLEVAPTKTSGVLAGTSSNFWVTVAVDRNTALRLAAALGSSTNGGSAGGLQVVRSTGEPTRAAQTSLAPPASTAPGGPTG